MCALAKACELRDLPNPVNHMQRRIVLDFVKMMATAFIIASTGLDRAPHGGCFWFWMFIARASRGNASSFNRRRRFFCTLDCPPSRLWRYGSVATARGSQLSATSLSLEGASALHCIKRGCYLWCTFQTFLSEESQLQSAYRTPQVSHEISGCLVDVQWYALL